MNLRPIHNKNPQIPTTCAVIMLMATLVMTSCSFPALHPSASMADEMVLDPDKLARIDAWLSQTGEDGTFSGSVLIAEKGQMLLSRGYGSAMAVERLTEHS